MGALSCGHATLDELIDGLRVGDNVVLQVADGVDPGFVVEGFLRAAAGVRPLAYIRTAAGEAAGGSRARAWDAQRFVLLDWTAGALAAAEPVVPGHVERLPRDAPAVGRVEALPRDDPAVAQEHLAALEDELGSETVYVVDSLTALAERWGADAALAFFLWACPRLYRHGPVALWVVWRERHDARFLARLRAITQVVLELRPAGAGLELEVAKADGRGERVTGRRVAFRVGDGELVDVEWLPSPRERVGELIRAERLARGVSQADLARAVGITPSALSQVERGVRGLSGERLTRVWERLGVPFGPEALRATGYRLYRRGGQRVSQLAPGATGRLVLEEARAVLWSVEVAPGAAGTQQLFAAKAPELVVVEDGAFMLEVGGESVTLQEGDALSLPEAAVSRWSNPGPHRARLLWVILRG